MNRPADAEVVLRLVSEAAGGKDRPVRSGYRPHYAIMDDYLTSTNHELIDVSELAPGDEGRAYIWFLSPEFYPHTLWRGREIAVSEGTHHVGVALIVRIFNPHLLAQDQSLNCP